MRPSKSVVIISRLGKFDTRLVLRAAVWYSNARMSLAADGKKGGIIIMKITLF